MTPAEYAALADKARTMVDSDISKLAPKFQAQVDAAMASLAKQNIDAYVYEAMRSNELEAIYFQLGTTKAPNALYSWHSYGLAVDVISRSKEWDAWNDPVWSFAVRKAFVDDQGCEWGGAWTSFPDMPHFQFGGMKASPSDEARLLLAQGGLAAVWQAVGAA
jgi:peptidoglycan L-alanyl-D-glutamate endopeptidase CwlK